MGYLGVLALSALTACLGLWLLQSVAARPRRLRNDHEAQPDARAFMEAARAFDKGHFGRAERLLLATAGPGKRTRRASDYLDRIALADRDRALVREAKQALMGRDLNRAARLSRMVLPNSPLIDSARSILTEVDRLRATRRPRRHQKR